MISMIRKGSNLRYVLPVIITSAISFALCTSMAVLLLREQSISAEAVGKHIAAWRVSSELQEGLTDLADLVKHRVEEVASLNDRTVDHINSIHKLNFSSWNNDQIQAIQSGFQKYLSKWSELASAPPILHESILRECSEILEKDVCLLTDEFHDQNTNRIQEAERDHQAIVRGLAWGLAGIGGSAALAGVFLGYGIARGLRRSIQGLLIHIKNAADKLDSKVSTIEFTPEGNLSQLDHRIQSLLQQIEQTVEKLQQREREVLRAEQLAAVGQLAAGVAHEIRNPLTSIKMLVQSGIETASQEMLIEDLQVIEREIRRMENSLKHFLDFARPPKLYKTLTEPSHLIEQTIELLRGRAQKQGVEIRFQSTSSSSTISADEDQLRQVFVNLALNALDVMPNGGVLQIDLRTSSESLWIEFQDSGPGIPPEVKEKLFRPFMSTKATGLGLGLIISRRILKDHGGSIEIEEGSFLDEQPSRLPSDEQPSRLRGACFRVCLPISRSFAELVNGTPISYR